jgi:serine/threonine protein kinase
VYEILKALIYIHSNGIAHRDIKAENILVKKQGEEYIVKVIDWGLGVLTCGEDLSRRCGTPEYCAPEVLMGQYNLECDMWSLGVLIYIMLSGQMPFRGRNLQETVTIVKKGQVRFKSSVWTAVSDQAKEFILKLL